MATSAITYPTPAASGSAQMLRIFGKEAKYEFLKLMRTKSFSLSTIGFPVMFYLLFGIANRNATAGNIHIAKYMLGGYACFGLIGAALFGIGVGVAGELAAGWLELKRASPMPASALSLRQMCFGRCLRSHHRHDPHHNRYDVRWSLTHPDRVRQDARHDRRRVNLLCQYGPPARLACSGKCGSRYCQSHLFAHVLPERLVDASAIHAALASAFRPPRCPPITSPNSCFTSSDTATPCLSRPTGTPSSALPC